MNYYDLLSYSVYIGAVTPLLVLGFRVTVLWGWSLMKKWGSE
jgi:hypothetical protein